MRNYRNLFLEEPVDVSQVPLIDVESGQLTSRGELFVSRYLTHWDEQRALVEVGYLPDHTLIKLARATVQHPAIREKISELCRLSAMSADEALARLADIGRADIGKIVDSHGSIDLSSEDTPTHNIKSISVSRAENERGSSSSSRVELYSKDVALTQILKIHGKFDDPNAGTQTTQVKRIVGVDDDAI